MCSIGGAGNDRMTGGTGDDIYFVDSAKDVVTESANQGKDTVHSAISHTLSANVENLNLLAGAGDINGTGNTLNNVIVGNDGKNRLDGGAGNDTIDGGAATTRDRRRGQRHARRRSAATRCSVAPATTR